MKLFLFFTTILLTCVGCQKEQKYEKFIVDRRLPANDTVRLLSKHPELKLFNSELVESYTRTAYIVHHAFYYDGPLKGSFLFNDYKCRAQYENDTLSILLNNDNGYFGNGVLVKVFNSQFYIKDIDPSTLKREKKFIKSKVLEQKLVLNTNKFNKNDSIYGFIDYKCKIDSLVYKHFRGYFKTTIQKN